MKRASASLVSYSSSSSDESEPNSEPIRSRSCKSEPPADLAVSNPPGAPTKRRKLPPLAASLAPSVPADDPTKHQGRIRSFPHVEGQYATHVYVPLILGPGEALYDLVTDVVSKAKEEVGGLWGVGEAEREDLQGQGQRHEREDRQKNKNMGRSKRRNAKLELHISLSRPIFLRAHQRDDFKRAVKRIAESVSPFNASFSTFSELTNDEHTRTFLSMEVGAGHFEVRYLFNCLSVFLPCFWSSRPHSPLFVSLLPLTKKEFYADPKFHASIAWALLDSPATATSPPPTSAASVTTRPRDSSVPLQALQSLRDSQECPSPEIATSACGSPSSTSTPTDSMSTLDLDHFPRIPHLPPTLISTLNASYAPRLSAARTGGFLVDKIAVRIGKEIVMWCLSGIEQVV
ncbi:hypothetical protein EV401DRAFT_2214841 [Pisolithus croceorrhizus]|nr:hypothetical protein EV401DRAFT_2214841 [Pisolithus croceorrhizus]